MEIRISTEKLVRALWIVGVALSTIGFLLVLYGLVASLTLDDGARIQEAVRPVAIIASGAAIAVIPWCLASSASMLLGALDGDHHSAPVGDGMGE